MKKIIPLLCILLLCVMVPPARAIDVTVTWEYSYPCYVDPWFCDIDGFKMYWGEDRSGPYPNQLFEVNATTLECNATLEEDHEYFLVLRAYQDDLESESSNEIHWYCKDEVIAARGMFSGQSTICGGFIQ